MCVDQASADQACASSAKHGETCQAIIKSGWSSVSLL